MVTADSTDLAQARQFLGRLYRFLREFAQLRYPVAREVEQLEFRLWFDELPEHQSIERGWLDDGADFALRVTRPRRTECPEPEETLRDWLQADWRDPSSALDVRTERTQLSATTEDSPAVERFEDDPMRVAALQSWATRRDAWAATERPARDAMRIFRRLYELHGRIDREREQFELYAGDAILRWTPDSGRVHHPLVLQAMQLDFEPDIPRFTIAFGDRPAELYTALLRSIDEVVGDTLQTASREFAADEYGPFSGPEIDGFLKALAVRLHVHGSYGSTDSAPRGAPSIDRRPLLMLRRRTQGFTAALDAIEADLPHREDVPVSLRSIVGVHVHQKPDSSDLGQTDEVSWLPNEDPDLLFTKPANDEQARIARQLEQHSAAMVQGPPGTGKTHTIANLIGHLLAQGKRVLVTSHTAKALERVREVIVQELQPLAVSAVGADAMERAQLEHAVRTITDRLARGNSRQLRLEAQRLGADRRSLLAELDSHRRQLRDSIYSEYRDIVVAGQGVKPSEAAREVRSGREQDNWIPGPVHDSTLTLSLSELQELYATNGTMDPKCEAELSRPLPPASGSSAPLAPTDFEALIEEERELQTSDLQIGLEAWRALPTQAMAEKIASLAIDAEESAKQIRGLHDWELTIIEAGILEGGTRKAWSDLLEYIQFVSAQASEAAPLIAEFGPKLPETLPLQQTVETLREIHTHIVTGGSLSPLVRLRHRSWVALLNACSVEVGDVYGTESIRSLYALAEVQLARERLRSRWRRTAERIGMPPTSALGRQPEQRCQQFVPSIRKWLDWRNAIWRPLVSRAGALGLEIDALVEASGPRLEAHGQLRRIVEVAGTHLPAAVGAAARRLRLNFIQQNYDELDARLACFQQDPNTQGTILALREAIHKRDCPGYARAFACLQDLWSQQPAWETRNRLLARLDDTAPAWAAAVRSREGIHATSHLPGNAQAAWRWRVLSSELDRRTEVDPSVLQTEVERLEKEVQRVTSRLVDRLAWAEQIESTSPGQQQSLKSWVQLMKKVGRGTGKRAPRQLAAARKLMAQSRTAVPVWIMPLSRVVETFDFATSKFDVLIVDEASQSDVLALTALYLAEQVVIVGDDEQVTPAAVGQAANQIERLIDQYLHDIPNGELYDGRASIYDLGYAAFGGSVQLREHFRCVPEIIEFSNQLAYQGSIRPLRDVSEVERCPALVAERVDGVRNDSNQNVAEAEFIVSAILASTEFEEYRDATFGAISMLSRESAQARLLESMLQDRMSPTAYQHHRILVGGPAQFQGDERDVMFLSLVDSSSQSGGPLRLTRDDQTRKRYNVAASRAKDQMWVVHSLNPEVDLQPEDLRIRLIRHAMSPTGISQRIAKDQARAEGPFERRVVADLIRAGYRVEAQHPVGALRIDLVVHGDDQQRVAVECDGDKYHTLDNLAEDLSRQALLERLGWRFVRIRGSEYFRNPEATIARVLDRLAVLGVKPSDSNTTEQPESSDLLDRVRARAAEIRQSWRTADEIRGSSTNSSGNRASLTGHSTDSSPSRDTRPASHATASSNSPAPTARRSVVTRPTARRTSGIASTPPAPGNVLKPSRRKTASKPAAADAKRDPSHSPADDVSARPSRHDEAASMRPTPPAKQMRLEVPGTADDVMPANTDLVARRNSRSSQPQLLREKAALLSASDALSAQTGQPGRVDLAKLIRDRSALARAVRLRGYPSSSTHVRKRTARNAIKAALAEIESESMAL